MTKVTYDYVGLKRELTVHGDEGELSEALKEAKRLAKTRRVSLLIGDVRVPISTRSTYLGVANYWYKRAEA